MFVFIVAPLTHADPRPSTHPQRRAAARVRARDHLQAGAVHARPRPSADEDPRHPAGRHAADRVIHVSRRGRSSASSSRSTTSAEYLDEAWPRSPRRPSPTSRSSWSTTARTDGSAAIAEAGATATHASDWFSRSNHGLGHARNTGVRARAGRPADLRRQRRRDPGLRLRASWCAPRARPARTSSAATCGGFDSEGTWQSGLHRRGSGATRGAPTSRAPGPDDRPAGPEQGVHAASSGTSTSSRSPRACCTRTSRSRSPRTSRLAPSTSSAFRSTCGGRARTGPCRSRRTVRTSGGSRDRFAAIGGVRAYLVERGERPHAPLVRRRRAAQRHPHLPGRARRVERRVR